MTDRRTSFGFRVVGDPRSPRRLVDWERAFRAHSDCDPQADANVECYLSAFQFPDAFRHHMNRHGTPRGYEGPTWSQLLWFDIDRDSPAAALADVRRLAAATIERWQLDADAVRLWFSGSKGFHVGLPLSACGSPPTSDTFHCCCRKLAESLAAAAGVGVDTGVYDRVRLFRAPNSRHPKTGLHKRPLTVGDIQVLSVERVLELARAPAETPLVPPQAATVPATADWRAVADAVVAERSAAAERRASGSASLTRATLEFIRTGAAPGDRHRLLFSAAANLAELGCPRDLAEQLLFEAAADAGLRPADIRRQIHCGLRHGGLGDGD
jgi:hypothetical protein